MQTPPDRYDVIVVGAGPAGMMAAGQAAMAGGRTLLIERMNRPGRKLQLTGKGRCNITNNATIETFMDHFGKKGRFLRSSFSRFFNAELLQFLDTLGVKTVTERGGRVFPVSQDAQEIVQALESWIQRCGVDILVSLRVMRLTIDGDVLTGLTATKARFNPGEDRGLSTIDFEAPTVIIATGGASYPGTGSTGDGFALAQAAGHTIIPIRPGLVPLVTHGSTAAALQGLSLRNVQVRLLIHGVEKAVGFGEMLFTHFGLSGPVILSLSRDAVDGLLSGANVQVSIDLKPALDEVRLDARILRDLDTHGKKQIHSVLKGLLPQKMIPTCLNQTGIKADKQAHQITAEERKRLRLWLKDLRFDITGHRSFRQAIITAGGVDLGQVDPRSMGSKLIQGLFFAGEVLDLDADTGGYNLQAAFSTGWVAGRSAARYALEKLSS